MTDLEFYQKALLCQSWLINRISESKAYADSWSNEFCLKDIRKATEKYFTDDYVKEVFTLDNLTKERAKALRFCQWDKDKQPDLYLFPLWFVFFLPYGTKVIGISGNTFEYSKETDLDIRFGCVAFGVELKELIMEEIEMWLARDKNNNLCLYDGKSKPIKDKVIEEWTFGDFIGFLPPNYFPEIQWSDAESTKVKLVLDK